MTQSLNKDDYLTERELSALWDVKMNTLQKWRSLGLGPVYIKRVGRIVYRKDDIAAFERKNVFQGTGQRVEVQQ